MEKIIDLHTHLETLGPVLSLRSRWQNHLYSLKDHLSTENRYILSVAMYPSLFAKYTDLKKMIKRFKKSLEKFHDVKLLLNRADLKTNYQIGIILHVESARVIDRHTEQLPELYQLGVRGIIPLHFVDNKLGASADDPARRLGLKHLDKGLTSYGHSFIEHCNQLKMWVDLSHSSYQTSLDILELANHVMISHVGVKDLVFKERNQPIKIMQKVAAKDGVIGLIPWSHLIGTEQSSYIEQAKFVMAQNLQDSLCIGSDFGAPIKTHKFNNSLLSLASSLNELTTKNSGVKWNNAYNFFEKILQ